VYFVNYYTFNRRKSWWVLYICLRIVYSSLKAPSRQLILILPFVFSTSLSHTFMNKKNTILEIIASLLVFLFLYAAISKLLDFGKFNYQLGQSPFITQISPFAAWAIPLGEIAISICLVIKRTRTIGLYLSLFLMLLFTGYIFIMLRYSPYLPCSCGGVLSAMSWQQHFVFNIAFTMLALSGILVDNSASSVSTLRIRQTGKTPNT